MKALIAFFFMIFSCSGAFAQIAHEVTGVVKDTTGVSVPGSTIKLVAGSDSSIITTALDGTFKFKNVRSSQFVIHISSVGYQPSMRRFTVKDSEKQIALDPFILKTATTMLNGVTVKATNAIKFKEDTTEYNANAYKVRDGAPVEDMIRKLPGVDVDKDGNVTAQGKSVSRVRVNGKDFMGGDLKTATRNLPANIVENIQLIDDYGDQANLTGIKSGEPEKILNINIQQDKNYGYFAQLTAGEGADAQTGVFDQNESNRYMLSANIFDFKGDRQLAFLGSLNNTNTSLFTFKAAGPKSGGPGGAGGRSGGNGGGTGASNGITLARSLGFNYRDQWSKKVAAYGSYSFADNTVNTISSTIQSNTSLTTPSINNLSNNQTDENINHRFNFNIEYAINANNYLKFVPTITFAGINTDLTQVSNLSQYGQTGTNYNLHSTLHSTAPNYGANLLYNHKFSTAGRNFSINASSGSTRVTQTQNPVYSYSAGTPNAPLDQLISTNVRLDSVGANLSYMEPVSKRSYLELSYTYHLGHTTSDKQTDTLTSSGTRNNYALLSNDYDFTFITHRVGLNYRFIEKSYNYVLGFAVQPAVLNGHTLTTGLNTHTTTFNIAPTARFVYSVSRSKSLSFNYNGASSQPSYTVLQPVIDFSNASYPVQGNALLKPEFNNNFSLRYNNFNNETGDALFTNLSFTQTSNKIVANSITYPQTYAPNRRLSNAILTQFLNADGYYSASGQVTYSKPWDQRKYTLSLSSNLSYNNNISYISSVSPVVYNLSTEMNIAKNLTFSPGVKFRVSVTDIIDAEFNGTYSVTKTNNSLPLSNVNNIFKTTNLGLSSKHYILKDYTLSYDYTKTFYQGFTGATNPNILNAYVERRFLKGNSGTIRLAVNDLFNQNTGFTTTQTGNYITQTQANRLGRYYMLSFSLRLQSFAGKKGDGDKDHDGGMYHDGIGGSHGERKGMM